MRKWLIIGAFFFGFFGLALTGHANPGKKKFSYSATSSNFKKCFSVGAESNQKKQDHSILLNLRSRAPIFSITALPATKETCTVLAFFHTGGAKMAIAPTERLLFDHLLHLFPSHYFW